MREKCAVVGLYSADAENAPFDVYQMLMALQHRGQDGTGISSFHSGKLHRYAENGLVTNVYKEGILKLLSGNLLVGHNRYGTEGDVEGERGKGNLQPCVVEDGQYIVHFVHNGNIPYYERLEKKIQADYKYVPKTNVDTELLEFLYLRFFEETSDHFAANKKLMKNVPGAYSYAALFYDKDKETGWLIGARDGYGVRPLIYSEGKEKKIIVSESAALNKMGIKDFRDLLPGEVVVINSDGRFESRVVIGSEPRHCLFEYSYFSSSVSVWEGRNVGGFRYNVGEILAEMYPAKADFVVPTPDSGRLAAEGYAAKSGIPLVSAIVRDQSIQRTFIAPPQRIDGEVRQKYFYNPSLTRDKRLVVVDDSSVRGKTMKEIVANCKEIGNAKEVHVRLAYPPIYRECDWGIAFRHTKELTAAPYFVPDPDLFLPMYNDIFARIVGADSAGFISIKKAEEALGLKGKLCLGCTAGKKPFEVNTY